MNKKISIAIDFLKEKNATIVKVHSYSIVGKLEVKCEKNHLVETNWRSLYQRKLCRECRRKYTLDECRLYAKTKGGKLLSNEYAPKLTWECKKGHIFKSVAGKVLRDNNWCKECFKESKSKRLFPIREIRDRINKLGFNLIDNTWRGVEKLHKFQCSKGHIFEKYPRHILYSNIGCTFCNNSFKSENKVRRIIESIFKVSFSKTRPKWLVNKDTNCRLELDCYNEDLKIAFEYDGHFHFEVRSGFNNDLNRTKYLDSLKNKICLENGVKLIRIPYWLKDQEIKSIINEEYTQLLADRQAARDAIIE